MRYCKYRRKQVIYIETYYLIDYENVHGNGLSGCQDLGKNDHIVIFFTQNARNIDMNDISNHGDAELEMIEVPTGKQSADMHIGSYLGYLAGKSGKNCNVVIVSKDTDFDKVIEFWKERTGISASRTQQIKKKTTSRQPVKTTTNSSTKSSIANKVNGTKKTKLNQEVMQAVRNAGFDASRGSMIMFVDGDDIIDSRIVEILEKDLELITDYVMVNDDMYHIWILQR